MDQFTPNQQMPVAPKKSKMGWIVGVVVIVIIVVLLLVLKVI